MVFWVKFVEFLQDVRERVAGIHLSSNGLGTTQHPTGFIGVIRQPLRKTLLQQVFWNLECNLIRHIFIVKAIKNGTLSIPWAKPGGASVSLTSTSVKPRSGSASQNAVPGHLNQESPSDQQVSLNREFKMTYSTDLRRRVIARVRSGDGKSAACRLFGISRSTLHSWLNRADLSPSQNGFRHRKLNRKDFERHVADHPDALQRERAAHFKVSTSSIRHALKRMGATRKKNRPVTSKEIPQAGSSTCRT